MWREKKSEIIGREKKWKWDGRESRCMFISTLLWNATPEIFWLEES